MSKRKGNLKTSEEKTPSPARIRPAKTSLRKYRRSSRKKEVAKVETTSFDEEEYQGYEDEEANMETLIETLSSKLKFHIFNPEKYEIETHRNLLIVPRDYRKTMEIMTKYEYTDVVSHRAKQIEKGSPVFVDVGDETDFIKMAELEIVQKKCPLAIRRVHNNLVAEIWLINEMSLP